MIDGLNTLGAAPTGPVWAVGPLMRAVADTLAARFNPLTVRGELSGFARATSGHCYFTLKDEAGQLRCALFKRAAAQLRFNPRDGQQVEARGRLDVYGPRGDLQLLVDSLQPVGQGQLFEQFLRLKALLEAEGLFDPARKRPLPTQPRRVGVVTSLGAAALRDVASTLRRRVPHLPVVIYPAAVQGAQAPAELCAALQTAYRRTATHTPCDVLLLVRGGGSLEDLWSFNDEAVVRTIAQAPMPVIAGVGHETDFTLADFVADLRVPTPTAAAELCAPARDARLAELAYLQTRLQDAAYNAIDLSAQQLDRLAQRLGRPSSRVFDSHQRLNQLQHQLHSALVLAHQRQYLRWQHLQASWHPTAQRALQQQEQRVQRCETALNLLDPRWVLARGYAWLTDADGRTITQAAQVHSGQALHAQLAEGELTLKVD